MGALDTRGVRIDRLELSTLHPRRVPIRSIITVMEPEVLLLNPRRALVAVQDVVTASDLQAAKILCLERKLALEFLREWTRTWSHELKTVFDSPGKAKYTPFDLVRIGGLLALDGGRRAATMTLKLKYSETLGQGDWVTWLSEECRQPDPSTHVGMLLINESGQYTQSRLLDSADSRHSEALALMVTLSDASKSDKRRMIKELSKRSPIQEVKKKQVKTVVGKKFFSEDEFFTSFAAASKHKAKTTTI